MVEKKSAVIIGAGIGGITASIYLAKNGYSVDVYEKNSTPGGRCSRIIRDGHRFDLGATMLIMPGIYHRIFDSLGIKLEEGRDILPLEDLYRIYFDDDSCLTFTADKVRMKKELEAIEPGSFEKSEKYIKTGYGIFNLGIDRLVARNFYNLFQFASFRNLGLLIKLKTYISHWRYTKRFFRNQHLLMAYTFQNIYVGQSPINSSALYSMVPAAELTEGSFYCRGGMFAVVGKLLNEAESSGVVFHYDSQVSQIKTRERKAECIVLGDGTEIKADIILANADLPYVYRELLPDKGIAARLGRMNYSCSAICFHWGLDKVYPQLSQHSVFLSDTYREGLEEIFINKSVSGHPSFYVHAPVRNDPSSAPPGSDTLSVIVAAGHIDKRRNQDWVAIRNRTRNSVLNRLKRFGMGDIDDHIKFEISQTPEDWENICNITRGSVFGSLGHQIYQMGYLRPHNRHSRYHNLYFVGGSTHPGNGIPNILISAKLVTERILSGK